MNEDMNKHQKKARAAERKLEVFTLYKSGHTYAAIAEMVGVSVSTVGKYIKTQIDELAEERKELMSNIVDVELERLDDLTKMLMRDVSTSIQIDWDNTEQKKETSLIDRTDLGVVDRLMKVMAQRSKYLGLNAPDKVEHNASTLEELLRGPVDEQQKKS